MRYIVLFIFICLASCRMESPDPFVRSVEKERFRKDSFFRFSVESPIPHGDHFGFVSLDYFKPDAAYRVPAKLERYGQPRPVIFQNSQGENENYFEIGKLRFQLKDKPYSLSVYQREDVFKNTEMANELFVPFSDETNGKDTYRGGRYMDLEYNGSTDIFVDFNLAYNPYCAYNHDFTCPVPPMENHLPIRVEAGEKIYHVSVR